MTVAPRPWPIPQVRSTEPRRSVTSTDDIGRLVREARQMAGVTQQSLADQAGTTRQWVIRLEQGRRTVTMGVVLDVLMVLGLEIVAELRSNDIESSGTAS